MATARGSCRAGSAKRVVSGATASQPANENISVAAALPTESQPCGANGVQFAARAAVADPAQGREHSGEQPRQPQQRQPGEDRSRPGLGRGQARQEQQAGPEDRPDVQCRAARGGEVRLVHRHNYTIAETAPHAIANVVPKAPRPAMLLRESGIKMNSMPEHVPDRVDRAIVATLQRDGRMANVDLADAISLSPSACLRRVKALEASGIIAGYRAEVSRAAAGLGLTVFIGLKVGGHSQESSIRIEQALLAIPAIVACYLVSGSSDFLVEAVVPDLAGYEQLLLGQILAIPSIVEAQSTFAIRTILSRGPLPLDHP